jgi:hypothetical protein
MFGKRLDASVEFALGCDPGVSHIEKWLALGKTFRYNANNIKSWADALANLPVQARWIAKADEVSSGNKAMDHVGPRFSSEGFFLV